MYFLFYHTEFLNRHIFKGWDLIKFTTSSRTFLSETGVCFLKLLVPYGAMVLICAGISSFTHYCFCIISANVNTVKKANNVLVLLWKWWLLHGHYLTLHGPCLKNHWSIHYPFPVTCPASVCRHHLWLHILFLLPAVSSSASWQNLICLLRSGLYFISEKLISCLLSWFNRSVFCASVPLWTYVVLAFITLRAEGLVSFSSTHYVSDPVLSLLHIFLLYPQINSMW